MGLRATFLTTPQLAAALARLEGVAVPGRTLGYWAASGLVVPSVDWQRKRRATRLYSLRDLSRARLVVRLRAARMSLSRVRFVLAALDARERNVFRYNANATLVVDGWNVTLHEPGTPGQRIPSGQFVLPLSGFIVGNEKAAREVKRAAA